MLHVYTVCYNTPELVRYQYLLLKKYIKGEFAYHVFDNTRTETHLRPHHSDLHNALMRIVTELGLSWYDVPRRIFEGQATDPSTRAGLAIDYATQTLLHSAGIEEGDLMFLLDNDAFPVAPFDVHKFMDGTLISGRDQFRRDHDGKDLRYVTNQLVIFRPRELEQNGLLKHLSFAPLNINGAACDCGGGIHHIFDAGVSYKNWSNALFSETGSTCQKYGGSPKGAEHFADISAIVEQCDGDKFALKQYIIEDTTVLKRRHPFCEVFTPNDAPVAPDAPMFVHQRAGTNWIGHDINKRNHVLYVYLENIKKEEPGIWGDETEGMNHLDQILAGVGEDV